jgi:hypothetical protein
MGTFNEWLSAIGGISHASILQPVKIGFGNVLGHSFSQPCGEATEVTAVTQEIEGKITKSPPWFHPLSGLQPGARPAF